MKEIATLIFEYGFLTIFLVVLTYFVIKYGDKYLKIALLRIENKNYMIDSLTKALENCTNVINHNTKALDNNSGVIKSYLDNSYKLEKKIEQLITEIRENDSKTIELLTEVKILKDRNC